MDYKKWFSIEELRDVKIEEIYQMFKARMVDELSLPNTAAETLTSNVD